ncbi:Lrp/AsnC family transcriptional regulator [Amycolatopsis sp. WQ 127309]|uniref:Lrp/AsnC family transcriptional regulator n=1 Tax=Amycolatopsis sp. WQ 127309 TaxID=2932773 RepID=UPI001FF52FF0|nr:Lrp/AsnC family transcriptional regulator [Amycolatopsis sp. WQ 127309]UOZ03427.1 Lrp/AsnC family transcriptional regulator [Amycolatopsis sp. WQ 127309]
MVTTRSELDQDDYRIIRALQLAPREGFARLGEVLGVSEATVARRYRRLRQAGVLHVAGVVDPAALGQSEWVVRVRCRPDSTPAIAEALAVRDDVGWVSLNAAGSEVTCALRSRSEADREHLLVELLPRVATVLDITASVVMHVFSTGCTRDWTALEVALTPQETLALGGAVSRRPPQPPTTLQPQDEAILSALAADGRATHVELATAADISPARAARRVQALLESGVLHLDVALSRAALGFTTRADLWLQVAPSAVRAVGKELSAMPEVAFAAGISGTHNMHAAVSCRTLEDLFGFVTDRIGALDGVRVVEVSPVLRQLKQFNTPMTGNRLTAPRPKKPSTRRPG